MKLQHEIDAFIKAYGPLPYQRGRGSRFDDRARQTAVDIVNRSRPGVILKAEICEKLGLCHSTVSLWRKNLEKVKQNKPNGKVRTQDPTDLPDGWKREPVAGEVTFELPGGGVVIGLPADVAEFVRLTVRSIVE